MAKIIGQSVAPNLAALYAALTSPGKITQGANGSIRLKKNKKKPKKPSAPDRDLEAFLQLATQVQIEYEDYLGGPAPADFAYNLMRELIVGFVNPLYFKKCKVIDAVNLQSVPTGAVDPNPPPYGFRTNQFMPTIPTYPDGDPSTMTPRYSGEKIGLHFYDTLLVWRKIAFTGDSLTHPAGVARLLFQWNTRLTLDAAARGSRPMYSRNVRAYVCRQTGSALTSTKPPISAKTNLYWRFKLPPASAPFFHTTQLVRYTIPFARIAKESGSGAPFAYLVNASNRPMMGRGYNNNDTVDTSFNTDPDLYEITKCFPGTVGSWQAIPFQTSRAPRDICYSPALGIYVAACDGYSMVSSDLAAWSTWFTGYNCNFWSIVWADSLNLFVMVGESSAQWRIVTSPDGKNWTLRTPADPGAWRVVAWSPSLRRLVVLNYYGGASRAFWSDDGLTWTAGTGTLPFAPGGCIWVEELQLFVATGDGSGIYGSMTSPDGKVWSMHNRGNYGGYKGVAWSPSLQLLCTTVDWHPDGVAATSPDGKNWTESPIGYDNSFNSVAWCPPLGAFVASGGSSGAANMLQSPDGRAWTPMATGNTQIWYAVRWIEESCRLVTCGPSFSAPKFMKTIPA